ncbi:LacI family DNA-binding transcriptional regulator [Arthrobacter agilis]|uniref:LacI family DNA-binding transcriptional regulator n=1 Tax=Arthrobacter agilis TaxID=37921 RepID=UPI0023655F97|nr:LacI family DNA-binding transcriptional regulator [Arthrobacter agilis]WDF33277.1 LacI family DNA-binding transcriptional regulator [Arthrobacter agilis]
MTFQERSPDMTDVEARRAPSLTDVAFLAGVSHQTVSRVVNRRPNVSDATRSKVRAAISELGYRPNAAARSLATGRTHSIGILTGEISQYGPSSVLMGIHDAAREAGYFLTVVTLSDYSTPTVDEALSGLLNRGVEGIIAITPHVSALEALERVETSIPLVTVGGGRQSVSDISLNQEGAAAHAVLELIGLGHQVIAHLSGPSDWVDARRRADGWRRALQERGLPAEHLLEGDWSARSGYQAGLRLDIPAGITAVFASNDQMALGLMKALKDRGYDIPMNISVIGFDDVPEAEFYEPPLTTVRQEFHDLGRSCIDALISHPSRPESARYALLPQLITRSSTARRV